jgi:hypothetical protein
MKQDLKKLRLESSGNLDTIFSKTTRLEVAKRIARSIVGIRKIKCWTLWKGRPATKTEKETTVRAEAGNVEAPAPNDSERKKKEEKNNVEEIDQNVSGCRSGRTHIRRERW